MERFHTSGDLANAVERLVSVEPSFAGIVARNGLPPLRHEEAGLRSLLRIVTDQLISLRAGEATWNRLAEKLDPFAPETVLAQPEEALRACGLSRAKARTFHAAARAFREGILASSGDPQPEEDVLKALMEIPGVGPWTASIYLLTVLKSADAWPAADLALQRAAMDLFSLPHKPDAPQMMRLAEAWRPFRSAAALLLWSHYRSLRQMPQA
jgi:DNA-3-methyladenine glycosylase II